MKAFDPAAFCALPEQRACFLPVFEDTFQATVRAKVDQDEPWVVVVAEHDPVAFAARLLACWQAGAVVILADALWVPAQWKAFWGLVGRVDACFGDAAPIALMAAERQRGWSAFAGCILVPSGGSSGSVKLVVHRRQAFEVSAQAFLDFSGLSELSAHLVLPLCYMGGLGGLLRAYVTGSTVSFGGARLPAGGYTRAGATVLALVWPLLARLMADEAVRRDLAQYAAIWVGAGPQPEGLYSQALEAGLNAYSAYGSTETAGAVAAVAPRDAPCHRACLGRLLPHATWGVEAEEGGASAGCLWVSAGSLYCSYYPEPPEVRQRWYTHDSVTLTPQGHMHFAGRRDNLLVSGGLKVDLGYVHDCLAKTGLIEAFCLLLRPHPVWGQAVHVYHTGHVDQAAIRAALEPLMPSFAIPRVWVQTKQLPLNDNGKIQPLLLR